MRSQTSGLCCGGSIDEEFHFLCVLETLQGKRGCIEYSGTDVLMMEHYNCPFRNDTNNGVGFGSFHRTRVQLEVVCELLGLLGSN